MKIRWGRFLFGLGLVIMLFEMTIILGDFLRGIFVLQGVLMGAAFISATCMFLSALNEW